MEKVKLGEVAKVITKGTTPTSVGYNFENTGINFVKIESISETGEFLKDKFSYISEECNNKLKRSKLLENDILFSIAGAIGRVAVVNKEIIPANINQALAIIRIDDRYNKNFLKFLLTSDCIKKQYNKKKQGVAQINLSLKDIADLEIPIIDLEEQIMIVHKIEKVQEIICIRKKQIEELDQLIKSQFIELFDGKYDTVKIGDVFNTTSGGTPSKSNQEYYENGTIPWLSSGEVNAGVICSVKNYITQDGIDNSSAKMVPKNSVVIAMYGATAGQVGLLRIATSTNQAVCSVLPNDQYVPEYLYYAVKLKKDWMISQCAGGAQPNISQAVIKRMEIIDAPYYMQRKFAILVEQTDKQKFEIQKSLEEMQKLKESLMNKYFN